MEDEHEYATETATPATQDVPVTAKPKRARRVKPKNMKVIDPLPMTTQPAILPPIGHLLDTIGKKLQTTLMITPIDRLAKLLKALESLPGLNQLLPFIARATLSPLYRIYRLLMPSNMFWPILVPRKVPATVGVVRDANGDAVDCCVWVFEWTELWRGGAFGKGLLSRSDPTWVQRYRRDMGDSGSNTKYLEDITRERRQERQQQDTTEPRQPLDIAPEQLQKMEPLQLSPHEALFLAEIGCLDATHSGVPVSYADLWRLYAIKSDFVLKYAAYYYYRAKGWVVKSGIKFGTDFLLYRGGPSKAHSQYSVVVRHASDSGHPAVLSESWQYLLALSRVTSQAQKKLVVCYIELPDTVCQEHAKMEFPPDLHMCRVREFVIQRFNPNRK
ncbi:tRNA-splicing endonuclease subunit Sen2 [Coemansia spiralis]|uniref:tRNA-intron lyase n=2 Tax=Coemansia TaxID=4863 RepID=A0A9W8KYZ8_9FUNG|nr:tRNA-splicing endonuclease subunit Sen2 [Coemansia umbellata]KAJ2623507.1 tRNA-splicing endonuclease subunit Sen2 [Coemansia sp. RSA 1358]KAJ2678922.1 tRNA-splicing endonuclease subunit Sen2 [Coemansia spiralis]